MKRVVLASANPGKLEELAVLLNDLCIDLVAQSSYHVASVEETGQSFVENAILKARYAARVTALPAIADDSGICVDVLQGRPGIRSARYAGPGASDADNISKLLAAMESVPDPRRSARFECVIVFLGHPDDPTPLICHGSWRGHILTESRGTNGFGYDPVFFVPETGCACAELDTATKNCLSHRAQASRQLVERLRQRTQD